MDDFDTEALQFDEENLNDGKEASPKMIKEKEVDNKTNISLPMTEASNAWMEDFEAPGFESDEEETIDENKKDQNDAFESPNIESNKKEATRELVTTAEVEQKKALETKTNILLPMTEASDAWMDDFEAPEFESDEDELVEAKKTERENDKSNEEIVQIEETKDKQFLDNKKENISLPMVGASDAWMDDFEVTLTVSDSETEDTEANIQDIKSAIDSIKSKEQEKFSLPMNEASEAWMEVIPPTDFDSEDELNDAGKEQESKLDNLKCYSTTCANGNCYSPTCRLEAANEKRLSAIEEAQKFSCDDDEECVLVKEEFGSENVEETSWAFVQTKNEQKKNTEILTSKEVTKSETEQNYILDVKVVTKETCLGRKLHDKNNETEWKMDIQCVQKDTIPNIMEGKQETGNVSKSSTLPRPKQRADDLCLSPSWMRKKDFTRTQSVEGIFGSVKDRKLSESRSSAISSSIETVDDNDKGDEVYWRIKHKVKKKKRRTMSESKSDQDLMQPKILEQIEEPPNSTSSNTSQYNKNQYDLKNEEKIEAVEQDSTEVINIKFEDSTRKESTIDK